ncbi:FecR family protein [bacterium A37T11]|nr:FecR family protein [bacterium A37T11]
MNHYGFDQFLDKVRLNRQNDADMEEFRLWLTTLNPDEALVVLDQYEQAFRASASNALPVDVENMVFSIEMTLVKIPEKRLFTTKKLRLGFKIAASFLLLTFVALYYYPHTSRRHGTKDVLAAQKIEPGKNKALLKLADGSIIDLDTAADGEITRNSLQTGFHKQKGFLSYQAANTQTKSRKYNILVTPRGGQFKLQLPDGTNVWLNASSQLRFPTVFDAGMREVILNGEAYFEVAKNSKSSFIVKTNRGDIRVLGTRFNVSSYQTDPYFTTTLVDGSVQIENGSGHTLLWPGQQAQVDSLAKIQINEVETAYAVAWKDGYFMFNKETIHEVMQKIARWYNVEVHYEGPEPKTKIWGTVSRFDQVGDVLHMLEATGGVKCKIIGRRIIVEG